MQFKRLHIIQILQYIKMTKIIDIRQDFHFFSEFYNIIKMDIFLTCRMNQYPILSAPVQLCIKKPLSKMVPLVTKWLLVTYMSTKTTFSADNKKKTADRKNKIKLITPHGVISRAKAPKHQKWQKIIEFFFSKNFAAPGLGQNYYPTSLRP